jgi:hypothetical protein
MPTNEKLDREFEEGKKFGIDRWNRLMQTDSYRARVYKTIEIKLRAKHTDLLLQEAPRRSDNEIAELVGKRASEELDQMITDGRFAAIYLKLLKAMEATKCIE